ncbi:hypothetical protein SK128_011989 [Halocaridina rubra]|uniref:Uncharacterized protein n=1 Tax=Halocaridina rubra TaxID=373956 RepID=A0AAN9A1V1_HALRR
MLLCLLRSPIMHTVGLWSASNISCKYSKREPTNSEEEQRVSRLQQLFPIPHRAREPQSGFSHWAFPSSQQNSTMTQDKQKYGPHQAKASMECCLDPAECLIVIHGPCKRPLGAYQGAWRLSGEEVSGIKSTNWFTTPINE